MWTSIRCRPIHIGEAALLHPRQPRRCMPERPLQCKTIGLGRHQTPLPCPSPSASLFTVVRARLDFGRSTPSERWTVRKSSRARGVRCAHQHLSRAGDLYSSSATRPPSRGPRLRAYLLHVLKSVGGARTGPGGPIRRKMDASTRNRHTTSAGQAVRPSRRTATFSADLHSSITSKMIWTKATTAHRRHRPGGPGGTRAHRVLRRARLLATIRGSVHRVRASVARTSGSTRAR